MLVHMILVDTHKFVAILLYFAVFLSLCQFYQLNIPQMKETVDSVYTCIGL